MNNNNTIGMEQIKNLEIIPIFLNIHDINNIEVKNINSLVAAMNLF
jgi:hypothetical protein